MVIVTSVLHLKPLILKLNDATFEQKRFIAKTERYHALYISHNSN